MENLCLASALPGTVFSLVLETCFMEILLPWLICSSFSLYLKHFVESKSRDYEITADNGADNYDHTKHPCAANNYFPEEEHINDHEEWSEDEDGDEVNDFGQQGSGGDSGDDNQDEDDDDDDDDSNEDNEDTGDECEDCEEEEEEDDEEEDCDDIASEEVTNDDSLKRKAVEDVNMISGKRYRAETSRGDETEDSSGQDELAKRYEALEAMKLQISQKISDIYRKYNDFWQTIDYRMDLLSRKHHAITTYTGKVCDEIKSEDPTLPLTIGVSIPKMDFGGLRDLPPPLCPPEVEKQGEEEEAQLEINVVSSNTRGGLTLNDKVEHSELQMTKNFQLLQECTQWLDYSCRRTEGRMATIETAVDELSTVLSTRSNDLRLKGHNIPLWNDDLMTASTSEEITNAVNKDSATLPSNPP